MDFASGPLDLLPHEDLCAERPLIMELSGVSFIGKPEMVKQLPVVESLRANAYDLEDSL